MKQLIRSIALLIICTSGFSALAQISQGGSPYTFTHTITQPKAAVEMIDMMQPDIEALKAEDLINDPITNYRVGLNLPVNLNVNNSGTWLNLPDGGRIWRLRIHSEGAMALGLYYHNFFIPEGGEVFIYNEHNNHVIGAFTSENNVKNQIRATQMIEGDITTIEYYEAPGTVGFPVIEIKDVVHFYRGVEDFVNGISVDATGAPEHGLEKAESCQVDVACSEGTSWTDQINSVVHYSFTQGAATYVCSASMVNNTSQDCTPYILTAWHCGEPTAGSNISSWVWYWNYQKTTCSPGSGNLTDPSQGTNTMTGGTVVASSGNGTLNNPPGTNQLAGSDFYLVQLSAEPPVSYNAFYAGWDRTNTPATSGVGIHHPSGSAKKISTYTSSLSSSTYNGGATNAHWQVVWSSTTNGHGVTEGGSSGSPIFNQSGRVVGQLSGGSSFCTSPTSPDLFGKLYTDWDLCGTAANAQLAPWLDPGNTGTTVLDGSYQPCNSTAPPTCGITASNTTVTQGGSVNFTDGSTGIPTTWAWNFDTGGNGGATPSTSAIQNPGNVSFANLGTYNVELIASNANGACTTSVNISVVPSTGCDSLTNLADTSTLTIYGSTSGFVTGTNDYGDLAKAEFYSNYGTYTHVTAADIYLYGIQDGGNGSTLDLTIWNDNAGLPGTIIGSAQFSLAQIAAAVNPSGGVLRLPFDGPVNVGGNPFYIGVDFSTLGAGDTIGIVSKMSSVSTPASSAFEQWSDGVWYDMASAWGGDWTMYINPFLTDVPVSGSISSDVTSACAGGSIVYTATGTNITGYDWTFNGTPGTSTNASETVTYSTAGVYDEYVFLEGACYASEFHTLQVTITNGPTVTATPTDPGCAGNDGQIVVSATGATSYSIDGGTTFQPSGTFTGLSAGTYNVVAQDAGGCQGTTTTTLNPGAGTLTVTSTSSNPSCGNTDGSIVTTVTGGTAPYQFSNDNGVNFNAGTSPYTFSALGTGTFDIVVSDANGCQGTDQVILANPSAPVVSATPADVSCNGLTDGSVVVSWTSGTAPFNIDINGSVTNGVTSAYTGNGLAAGAVNITLTDANNCTATTSVTINEPTAVAHTATVTNASCGSNNGAISVTATGGSGTYTYSNDNGANFQPTGSFTGLAVGSYNVIVMDGNGCTSVTSAESVTGAGNVTASISSSTDETCAAANGQIVISQTGGSAPYQYSVDGGVTFQSSATFNGLAAGTYNVVVEDAGGCQGTTTSTLINTGGVTPTISADQTICFGNTAIINAGGAGAGGTYSWDNGLGTGSTQSVTPSTTTTYTVTITDVNSCQATASTVVTVQTVPTVTVSSSAQTICSGESVTLTASGAQTYVWNTGATTSGITVSPTSQTPYTVVGQNGSCSGSPVTATISVNPSPTIIAGADQTSIPVGGTVNFSNAGSGATSYSWNFGDGGSSTIGNPSHTFNTQGVYTVILSGTLGNCTSSDTLTINVGVTSIDDIALEDAVNIYPNPNNGNFRLNITLTNESDVEIKLFNTIGELIDTKTLLNTSDSTVDFDLSNKAEGFYLVNIKTDSGSITKRISIIK